MNRFRIIFIINNYYRLKHSICLYFVDSCSMVVLTGVQGPASSSALPQWLAHSYILSHRGWPSLDARSPPDRELLAKVCCETSDEQWTNIPVQKKAKNIKYSCVVPTCAASFLSLFMFHLKDPFKHPFVCVPLNISTHSLSQVWLPLIEPALSRFV